MPLLSLTPSPSPAPSYHQHTEPTCDLPFLPTAFCSRRKGAATVQASVSMYRMNEHTWERLPEFSPGFFPTETPRYADQKSWMPWWISPDDFLKNLTKLWHPWVYLKHWTGSQKIWILILVCQLPAELLWVLVSSPQILRWARQTRVTPFYRKGKKALKGSLALDHMAKKRVSVWIQTWVWFHENE